MRRIGAIRKYSREIIVTSFAILAAYIVFNGVGEVINSACGNDVSTTVFSPDRKLKVVLFNRDCGATTAVSAQISILNSDEKLSNRVGNLFVANHASSEDLTATWKNNSLLEISGARGLEIFKQKNWFGKVEIRYK